jgi:hypothetical protein
MGTWYSLDIGDGIEAALPTTKIQEAVFALIAAKNGNPKNIAVFSRYDLGANIVTVYFAPETEVIARAFNASPCEKPSSDGIGLIAGDGNGLAVFFLDRKRS